MSALAWGQLAAFLAILLAAAWPVGGWIARVYGDTPVWTDRLFGRFEQLLYRTAGVDPSRDMAWHEYAAALLTFSVTGVVTVY
ncbi:MAG TPA: potassium-transporting ATPase subunit KdpA, partial [Gemmatimonadales bacterium]|nr:potassium-transporting ATPase subunit KdpA [Gemmatimonadales bacterium]